MTTEYAIDEAAIGQSGGVDEVGPAFDWFTTVISQYANSPILLRLLENMSENIDPNADLNDFFNLIWNVDTAQGYGLDVWGRIVAVGRIVTLTTVTASFGFEEAGDELPFNQGTFQGGTTLTQSFFLSDTPYRRLILAKALANICDGSTKAINQILINLFSNYGNCYVVDLGGMAMQLHFSATLSPVDLATIQSTGVIPKPAGVTLTIVQGP